MSPSPFLNCSLNENMEFPALSGEDIEWLQDEFVKAVFKRIEESKENRFIAKEDRGKVSRADGAAQRKNCPNLFCPKTGS